MGFNSVYRVLQDVFPQVDARILRAVAIEHSKDADQAVEVVLVEVIPFLSEKSLTVIPSDINGSLPSLSEAVDGGRTGLLEAAIDPVDVIPCTLEQSTEASSASDGSMPIATEGSACPIGSMEFMALDASSSGPSDSTVIVEPVTLGTHSTSSADGNGETVPDCDGVPILLKERENKCASSALICENAFCDDHDQRCVKVGVEDVASLGKFVGSSAAVSGSIQGEAALDVDITTVASKNEDSHLDVDWETSKQLPMPFAPTSSELGGDHELQSIVTEELIPSSSSQPMSEKDAPAVEMVDPEDGPTMNSMISRSDQICSTELLEDIIEDARNNKKILVSAMDSAVNLMREVECKEKAAEQAKEKAAWGCSDILAKVDELKQALWRAKEANDMHAGEVYAEKAILGTEVKELQLRLLNLSDERDRSLGILDEMRIALEIRLAASLKEIEAAEEEKLEKERTAREALAYQESEMEKVVEESKRLKQEAEENTKLQEFLTDRGRVIDMLQGEISVKCQDVRLLKEKFDRRIPLGRSLSLSQTSSILASSSSSQRSFPAPEPEPETFDTPKKNETLADSYGFLEKSSSSGQDHSSDDCSIDDRSQSREEKHSDDRKVLPFLDDGWELFDGGDLDP